MCVCVCVCVCVCECEYISWAWVQHGVVAGSVLQVPINGGPKGILVCQQLHIYSSTSSARYHYFVGFLFCFALFSNIPLYTPQNINNNHHWLWILLEEEEGDETEEDVAEGEQEIETMIMICMMMLMVLISFCFLFRTYCIFHNQKYIPFWWWKISQ